MGYRQTYSRSRVGTDFDRLFCERASASSKGSSLGTAPSSMIAPGMQTMYRTPRTTRSFLCDGSSRDGGRTRGGDRLSGLRGGVGLSIEFVPNPLLAVAHQSDAARIQTFAFAERYFFVHPRTFGRMTETNMRRQPGRHRQARQEGNTYSSRNYIGACLLFIRWC